jgi:phage host-nuclease inhibitor protein Gam
MTEYGNPFSLQKIYADSMRQHREEMQRLQQRVLDDCEADRGVDALTEDYVSGRIDLERFEYLCALALRGAANGL